MQMRCASGQSAAHHSSQILHMTIIRSGLYGISQVQYTGTRSGLNSFSAGCRAKSKVTWEVPTDHSGTAVDSFIRASQHSA